jgi:hypothetical protein
MGKRIPRLPVSLFSVPSVSNGTDYHEIYKARKTTEFHRESM